MLLILIAALLLLFQGVLYQEFYKPRVLEGSNIPLAFGSAAVFIAAVELLNFYWSTHLALAVIAWLLAHALFAPLHAAAQGSAVLANAMRRLPSRVPDDAAAGTISETEAVELANRFVLVEIGDHLKTGAVRRRSDGAWVVPVKNKTKNEPEGTLVVDQAGKVRYETGSRNVEA